MHELMSRAILASGVDAAVDKGTAAETLVHTVRRLLSVQTPAERLTAAARRGIRLQWVYWPHTSEFAFLQKSGGFVAPDDRHPGPPQKLLQQRALSRA